MSSARHLEAKSPSGTFSSFSKQHSIDTLVVLTHENICQKTNLLLLSHEIFWLKKTNKETKRFVRQCLRKLFQSCHQRLMRNHLRIILTFRIYFLSSCKPVRNINYDLKMSQRMNFQKEIDCKKLYHTLRMICLKGKLIWIIIMKEIYLMRHYI